MCQYPLFETVAIIDGKIQNIFYHQQRMNNAFIYYFKHENSFELLDIIKVPEAYQKGLVRCRIDYNTKEHQVQFFHYIPKAIKNFQCVYVENFDYQFKYTDRVELDKLKQTAGDEIILVNNGFISDCSIGNLLFLKQGKWYSPNHYLLKGTQLSYLLDEQKISLIDIPVEALFDYEQIMVINALNPFDLQRAVPITSDRIFR
ncbi:aminotransferase class IV family protein [Glaesserella parasuis]|uniref:aminotransferase class IV family protein n=1 Tax=Glaesserella parasuis TaxID=738 RepID=UPI0004A13A60|nr:aminotransferase class IV family protein [Glaesserella parasuis]KDD79369.1 branched-chain amino acid aminotransferase [Glaesserella parasuis ST4-1]MDE4006363.1 aminotransferase class IV family protein [Glaesserella parasuis]MDG6332481.1 aminotransferase class IV family protein [Glaesserella parasuis]MDG6874866.1 aminotransferase class IV family protein [Glaesserella parasuis]MDP0332258.1 aminotransferase class IV family protein [Glaesserella parasuis]